MSEQVSIQFFHDGAPPTATAQHRRHGRNGKTWLAVNESIAAAWYQAVFERYAPAVPFCGPLRVRVGWHYPLPAKRAKKGVPEPKTTRPDLDNLAKLLLDAATKAGYWKDDAQIVELILQKWAAPFPGLAFEVEAFQ